MAEQPLTIEQRLERFRGVLDVLPQEEGCIFCALEKLGNAPWFPAAPYIFSKAVENLGVDPKEFILELTGTSPGDKGDIAARWFKRTIGKKCVTVHDFVGRAARRVLMRQQGSDKTAQ
jgi:hypothetical protein